MSVNAAPSGTLIVQVLVNVLENAVKYSPKDSLIEVSASLLDEKTRLQIADRGVGIPSEDLSRIFDKFYRVHTGNVHDVKGFGLGLSYVKAMMTVHKGNIEVKSEPGKGSSFILFFPHKVDHS